MAKVIHKIQVEVAKPNFFQAIVAKQFDSGSRFLQVTLADEGKKIEIAKGSTVTINARRSDGAEKKFAGTVNGDGTVTVPLVYWMLELEGKVHSDVSVTDALGSTLTSTKFDIEVERASCKDGGVSEDDAEVDVLISLIKEVQNIKDNYDVKQTYDPTSTNAISGAGVEDALNKFAPPEIVTDDKMSDTSTNPVQNKVAKAYVDGVDFRLTENISSKFDVSANLYNEATNIVGRYPNSAGVWITDAQFNTTDFIYVKKGTYTMTYDTTNKRLFEYMAKYNLNQEFAGRTTLASGSIEIKEDCYIRLIGRPLRIENTNIMLVKGTKLPTEYVPYSVKLKPEYLPETDVGGDGLSTVTIKDTDFIKTSANLINQMTIENQKVISMQGVKNDDANYSITGKIYLKPSTTYTVKGGFRISYFDKQGNHKQYQDIASSRVDAYSFTTPNDFDYAIVTLYYNVNIDYKWQLNEGSELLPYELQHLIINGYRIYDEPDVEVDIVQELRNKDEAICDKSLLFTLDNEVAGVEYNKGVDASPLTSDEIFDMYDALKNENPDYITKMEIGLDDEGKMMYRYDFNQPDVKTSTDEEFGETQKAKIILVSGVHGEYNGIYSLFNTMKQITTNPKLFNLKSSVHFIVVPVVDVYAVNNMTNYNSNRVDIGRDFEYLWIEKEFSGTKPLSQKASQYIANLMAENNDATLFVSCHSFAKSEQYPKSMMWCPAGTAYTCNLAKKVIEKLTKEWTEKYPDKIPSENGYISNNNGSKYLGLTEIGKPRQNEETQALMNGIQSVIFEVCESFYNTDGTAEYLSSFICSRGTEVYVNFLLTVCQISSNEKTDVDEIKNYVDEVVGGIENGSY
jgi:hypothetical protein